MICFIIVASLAYAAGEPDFASMSSIDTIALAMWILCDIELFKLIFGKGR